MTTYTISYFRNHALKLLDQVAKEGEELVITRHGKPLAHVEPVKTNEAIKLGTLKGTLEIKGDIVGPVGGADWKACR